MEGIFLVLHDFEDGHQIRLHVPHIVGIDECVEGTGEAVFKVTNVITSTGHWFRVKESADEIQDYLTKIVRWR